MDELIYGYMHREWRRAGTDYAPENAIPALLDQGANGIVVLDNTFDGALVEFADRCRADDLDFILMFRWPRKGLFADDLDYENLTKALRVTNRLALGNVPTQEWYGPPASHGRNGVRTARRYKKLGRRFSFDWVCTVTHRTICQDIRDNYKLKAELADVFNICLCGYILVGYAYGDVRMPHQRSTSLGKRNLNKHYGLTADTLKKWLEGTVTLTGAGLQIGLDGGSRAYAREVGFAGICSGMPFDLAGTLDVPILTPPKRLPYRCGIWDDYQNIDALTESERRHYHLQDWDLDGNVPPQGETQEP